MTNHNSILEVNLKNLQYNYKKLSGLANRSICAATIKSDAYGLGVLDVFDALYRPIFFQNFPRWFYVHVLQTENGFLPIFTLQFAIALPAIKLIFV